MLNLKRFSKISSGAKLQFGQTPLARKKVASYRLAHTDSSSSRKSNIGKYVLGSLILGCSSIVVYAKYDPKFRQWLKTNIKGSDELLKMILFEEKGLEKPVSGQQNSVKPKLVPTNNKSVENVLKPTPTKVEAKVVNNKTDKALDNELTQGKTILMNITDKLPSNFKEIESESILLFKEVSDSYSDALNALKNYYELVSENVNGVSNKPSSWAQLKKMSVEKDELYQTAKKNAQKASKRLDQLQCLLDDSKIQTANEVKENIKNNIHKLKVDIKNLGNNFEDEKDNLLLFSKYNNQVINIRKQFSDELQALFPHVRLEDKDMKLTDAEFNVFINYVTKKLLFYQNELFKQETVGEEQVNDVVDALKKRQPDAVNKVLEFQVEKNRRKHMDTFIKESFGVLASSEEKFKQQLRLQSEVHMDHLKEAAGLAEKEVERRVRLEYSEKAEIEKLKYQEQVSGMTAVMHAINDALKEHSENRVKLNESVSLWTACQSLFAAITTDHNASKHELKPLLEFVNDVKKSGQNNKVINELLNSIPERALTRGVYTEETLKDRFFSVEDKAFHMAIVPDKNVKLFDLVTSFVFTTFTFKSPVPIPEEELNNKPINVNDLNNIDILQRARYWVERDNYYQALGYMNLLKGGAKVIADEWVSETREYLETQQAAHTLLVYASATLRSLVGNKKNSV